MKRLEQLAVPVARRARRTMLGGALGAGMPALLRAAGPLVAGLLPVGASATLPAAAGSAVPPEAAPSLEAAIRAFTGGAPVRAGKVRVQIAPLVDNGNTVPLSVTVDHPMRPDDHVAAIAVFSERNPQHEVASFGLGPRNPAARVSTRIRLATSQKLVAVARLSDGSHWSGEVDVIVTLAACIED